MMKVSIVILNWNGESYLRKFLPLLVKHSQGPDTEIVVADNASSDGSMEFLDEHFPRIRQVRLERNYGFSEGYNRALARLDPSYFLLLNSDVEVTAGWLNPLTEVLDSDERVAACTPRIRDYHRRSFFEYAGAAGGFIDRYGYPFCRGRIFDHLEEDRGQYDDETDVFWGSGACLLVRASCYREAGGLDNRFFAHMEEIDLCWRLQRMGYTIRYVPRSTVYHVGGGTLERGHPRKTYLNFRNNLLLLHKNLPSGKRRRTIALRICMDGISILRFLAGGAFKDALAVLRAHMSYYGMNRRIWGMNKQHIPGKNDVIVRGIYPGSIVIDYFLRGKKRFGELDQGFRTGRPQAAPSR